MAKDAFVLAGENQYLEVVPSFADKAFSVSFWFRYRGGDNPGGIRLLTWGSSSIDIALPMRKLLLHWETEGVAKGVGPFGPEIAPGEWHLLCLAVDGSKASLFLDGRLRQSALAAVRGPSSSETPMRIGSTPGLRPRQAFHGEMTRVTFHDGALGAPQCLRVFEDKTTLPCDMP